LTLELSASPGPPQPGANGLVADATLTGPSVNGDASAGTAVTATASPTATATRNLMDAFLETGTPCL
jgi:hypothetical protein